MFRSFCIAAFVSGCLFATPTFALAPQGCGTSFVEAFDFGGNEGNWAFSGIVQANPMFGGNPGWHAMSQPLNVSTVHFRTTNPNSIFCGDWRARVVTATGIDFAAIDIVPEAESRKVYLVLYHDNFTADDPTDDPFVYVQAGPSPTRGGDWRSYTVDVPSTATSLPTGWSVGGGWSGSADALWNLVLQDVQRVAWIHGHPALSGEPVAIRLRVDNPRLAFEDGPTTYCVAQMNSQGCSPSLQWFGLPSATLNQPFFIAGKQIINQSPAMLIYGFAPVELPAFGGLRCVGAPLRRTNVQNSFGSPAGVDCTGELLFDFNAHIRSGVDPLLVAGATVYAQYWSRDNLALQGVSLSNGLRFTICP